MAATGDLAIRLGQITDVSLRHRIGRLFVKLTDSCEYSVDVDIV
jgi:hypothetical protein